MSKKLIQAAAGAGGESVYVEDVFSTYLYEGNSSSQTITTGINASDNDALFWAKMRDAAGLSHRLADTVRGINKVLVSNTTAAEATSGDFTSASSTGITVNYNSGNINQSGNDDVLWTFRKQAGFFDVVTYSGNGTAGRTVSHNLGSKPAFIMIKILNSSSHGFFCYHESLGATKYLTLNTTNAANTGTGGWNDTEPTSTEFTLGSWSNVNASGFNYVAYLFAHDDQSFGDDSDESIIKCGSFTQGTTSGSTTGNVTVNLGFEPQWLLIKNTTSSSDWVIYDVMRGVTAPVGGGSYPTSNRLRPNTNSSENNTGQISINATGFTAHGGATTASDVEIYIAIRRPMKTPESGTEVFTPIARTGTGATAEVTGVGFAPDMLLQARRTAPDWPTSDRLRGVDKNLGTPYTQAETTPSPAYIQSYDMDGVTLGSGNAVNGSGLTYIEYFFKRAPGFFDVVAFSGSTTLSERTYNHNLGVQPELIIIKSRSGLYGTDDWYVATNQGAKSGESIDTTKNHTGFQLNGTAAVTFGTTQSWSDVCSSTTFTTSGSSSYITNSSGSLTHWNAGTDFIAYLFATVAGVSKVGSYTGTGTTNNIDCGFSSSARFVMVKRTSSTGDWYVWDSARGITTGLDPFLKTNTTDAEGTPGSNIIEPYSSGFTLTNNAGTAINGSGSSFIFLAIA